MKQLCALRCRQCAQPEVGILTILLVTNPGIGCQSKRTTLRLEEYAALTDERARLEFLANLCADIHLVCWGQQVWCPRPPDRSGQCVHLLKQVNSQFMTLVKY